MKEPQILSRKELERQLRAAESALNAIMAGQVDTILGEDHTLVVRLEQSEARERHLKRVLHAIRNVNQLIAREDDVQRLIEGACANLTANMGCHDAWIVLLEDGGHIATRMAASGFESGLDTLRRHLARGKFPTCARTALQREALVVVQDPDNECPDCPIRNEGPQAARLVCRMEFDGRVFGLLSFSVPSIFAHDLEEQALFAGVAGDLAFALYKIQAFQEREHALAALEESEARLYTLFDHMASGVAIYTAVDEGADFVFKDFNRGAERIENLTRRKVVGRRVTEVFSGVADAGLLEALRRVWQTGTAEYLHEVVHRDARDPGSWREGWVYKLPNGEVVAVYDDVTERKQAEKELHETAGILKAAMDCSPAGIAIADAPGGQLRYVNEAGLAIRGGTREELVENVGIERYAESWQILDFEGTPLAEDEIPLARAVRYGEACDRHFIIRRPDHDRIVWANAAPVLDESGAVKAGIVVFSDITDLKEAERALLESEKKFERLVESSPHAIFVQQEGRFAYLNRATCHLFGADANSELQGKPILERIHPDFRPLFSEQIRRLDGEKGAVALPPGTGLRMDGSAVPVEMTAVPIEYEKRSGVLVFMWDISQQLEKEKAYNSLQEQLMQAQRLESVGRLAGGVAHDFNNILSVIIGYAQLAADEVDTGDPLHGDLKEILDAAQRSRNIIRQLLAFARKETIAPEVLDFNETVENLLKMLQRLIGEDIDLAWHPAPELWPIRMDPSQVDQILANLCVNARDAIQDVGKVTIETGSVSIDDDYCKDYPWFKPGDFVVLTVSDDGCGIARSDLNKIFEPFFTTKELGRGTGLGLATVYGIVKQNEGFINVYSEPGEGTSVRIYLPRQADGSVGKQTTRGETSLVEGRGETVLVVEDDPAILKLTSRILAPLNYKVLEAPRPREAVALATQHEGAIDLLVTDVVMPDMNGRELSETLTKLFPEMNTLFMSGYTTDVIAHRGILDADVHFLHKPFSKKKLAAKVREALDGGRGTTPP